MSAPAASLLLLALALGMLVGGVPVAALLPAFAALAVAVASAVEADERREARSRRPEPIYWRHPRARR